MSELSDIQRQTLVDAFFSQSENSLLADIQAAVDADEANALRSHIGETANISDPKLIDRLVDLGIGYDTVAAVSLAPLLQVAWADGKIQDEERSNLLQAAHSSGMQEGSLAYRSLEMWLRTPPPEQVFGLWKEYIVTVLARLDEDQKQLLRNGLINRTELVGAAHGGIMKIGSISASEQRALDEIASILKTS